MPFARGMRFVGRTMLLVPLLVGWTLSLSAPVGLAAQDARRADSVALQRRVVAAEARFFEQWREAWKASEAMRHQFSITGSADDAPAVHCHVGSGLSAPQVSALVKSQFSWFAVCASWFRRGTNPPDERQRIDNGLDETRQRGIRAARETVLAVLDSAQLQMPSSDFIVGQRIRLLVDQGESDRALRVARSCGGSVSWCGMLLGYVLAADGALGEADAAFAVGTASVPSNARCQWTDVRVLLDTDDRARYARMSCAARDSMAERVWWLADPLFMEPGNERRVEQYVRRVTLALRTATEPDERFYWSHKLGGDAREELVLRYGWPTYVYWSGVAADAEHTGWLRWPAHGFSRENEPYVDYEYTSPRSHVVPAWHVATDPFHATVDDLRVDAVGSDVAELWPVEHYFAPYRLTQLPDGQVAMLRRDTAALLAVATQLDPATLRRSATVSVDSITLVLSPRPNSFARISTTRGLVGAPVVLRGFVPTQPAIASVEIPRDTRGAQAARVRFPVHPPPPLTALQKSETAISDPVLLQALPEGIAFPNAPDSALNLMASSTVVQPVERLGVYWETYGFKPTDSLEIAVTVQRFSSQGIARRFGIVFSIAQDLNTPLVVTWTESQAGRTAHVFGERVPILGRSVSVDVSHLMPGKYWLQVAVRRPGQEPVAGRREFTVVRSQ